MKGINWKEKKNKQLLNAVLSLKNTEEASNFLRDIMTEKEVAEFANRLEAASLFSRDLQYNAITETTGLSSKTIARISKYFKGSFGGYRLVLNRMHPNNPKLRKGLSLSS